jgi:hypothetical protein
MGPRLTNASNLSAVGTRLACGRSSVTRRKMETCRSPDASMPPRDPRPEWVGQ